MDKQDEDKTVNNDANAKAAGNGTNQNVNQNQQWADKLGKIAETIMPDTNTDTDTDTTTGTGTNSNASSLNPLQKELEEAKQKAEENWNHFLRARADTDNIRRRAQLDNDNARKFAIEKFAKEILVVMDSLEHGLIVAESAGDAAYKEGMALTIKLFLDVLEKFNITQINPKGEVFDPLKHEAISVQETNEVPNNTVLQVAQGGFVLNDRVLRPARVIVSRQVENQ